MNDALPLRELVITSFLPILRSGKLLLAVIIRSLRKSSANLSGDPRTDSINELNTSVIAPVIAVLSLELQVPNKIHRASVQ